MHFKIILSIPHKEKIYAKKKENKIKLYLYSRIFIGKEKMR